MRQILLILALFFLANVYAQKIDTVFTEKNGVMETFYFTLLPEQSSKGLLVILGGFVKADFFNKGWMTLIRRSSMVG